MGPDPRYPVLGVGERRPTMVCWDLFFPRRPNSRHLSRKARLRPTPRLRTWYTNPPGKFRDARAMHIFCPNYPALSNLVAGTFSSPALSNLVAGTFSSRRQRVRELQIYLRTDHCNTYWSVTSPGV